MKNLTYYVSVFAVALAVASVARGNVTSATVTSGGQTQTINIVHAGPSSPASVSRGWGFVFLPPNFTPAGASQSGVVILSEGMSFYRWRAGTLEPLGEVLHHPAPWVNPANGQTYAHVFSNMRVNAQGEVAVCWWLDAVWRNGRSINYGEVNLSRRWALEAPSQEFVPPLFTYQGSPDHIFHKALGGMHAFDDSGVIWATAGLEVVQADTHSWRLRQGIVRIDRGGVISPTKLQAPDVKNGTSFVLNGVNGAGTSIGYVVAGGTKTFFVGDTEVDFDPSYISKNGWILSVGANGHRVLRDPSHAIVPLPQDGTVEWVDGQDRLNGYYIDGSTFRRAVWLRRTDSSGRILDPVQYDRYDYLPLQPPGPWTTNHEVAPGSRSLQAGIVTRNDGSGEQRAFIAVPAELAVDGDRNGRIELSSESAADEVTREKPFRFWINGDDDNDDISTAGPTLIGNSDDPGPSSFWGQHAGRTPDWANPGVDGRSDLLDFFPVYLDIKQLMTVMPPGVSTQYKLKQADGALNFVYTDLKYTPPIATAHSEAFDYLYASKERAVYGPDGNLQPHVAPTHQITAAGVVLDAGFLDRVKTGTDRGVILIEGRKATDKPLVLAVEKDGVTIAEVALHIKISPVEDMYRWINLRGTVGQSETRPTNMLNGAVAPPPAYPDDVTNGKMFIWVHGYNVNERQSRAWFSEAFKRLYQSGSRAMFTAVSWHGDKSQVPVVGFAPDYWDNIPFAFRTGEALASIVNGLPGSSRVIAGHSMGNVVVSSAIKDHGMNVAKYFMVNAAVALEAYDTSVSTTGPYYVNAMRPLSWGNFERRLWSTDWWKLFPEGDNRRRLTWMNRFGNFPHAINVYSSGEEVLNNNDLTPGELPYSALPLGAERVWIQQEMSKGGGSAAGTLAGALSGEIQGGWGINQSRETINPATTTDELLRVQPVFTRFNNDALMSGAVGAGTPGSNAADAATIADLLGGAIPALSFPAGRNPVPLFGNLRNRDLMSMQDGWPSARPDNRWLHSDVKNIAYPFNRGAWDFFTNEGNLR